MKDITKMQKFAPFIFFTWMIISVFALTFFDAGKTFCSMTFWSFSMIFLFVMWLLSKKRWDILETYKIVFICLFIFSIFAGISFLVEPFSHFGYMSFILIFTIPFIFFTISTMQIEKIHLRWLFKIVCLLALMLCIYGLYRYIYFPFERVTGPFMVSSEQAYFPNGFSFLLLMIIPVQVVYLFNQSENVKWTWTKIYFLFGTAVIFATFFLIYSRSSTLSLFIVSIVFIVLYLTAAIKGKPIYSGKAIRTLLNVMIASFVLITVVNGLRSVNYDYVSFQSSLSFEATEYTIPFTDRFNNMEAAIDFIVDKPLFGIGLNNFEHFYPLFQEKITLTPHASNFILKIASETGLLSGIFFLAFYVFIIIYTFKNVGKVEQKYYTGMLAFIVLSATIDNFIDYNLNYLINDSMLAIFGAILLSRFVTNIKKPKKGWKYFAYAYLTAVVVLVSVVAVHEYASYGHVARAQMHEENGDYVKASDEYSLAANSLWFKEDFEIKSAKMYEILDSKNKITQEQSKVWLERAENATVLYPFNSDSYHEYANALCANNSFSKAAEMYNEAIGLDPVNHHDYMLNFIKCMWENDKVDDGTVQHIKYRLGWYNDLLRENPYLFNKRENEKFQEQIYEFMIENVLQNDEEIMKTYEDYLELHEEFLKNTGGQERT